MEIPFTTVGHFIAVIFVSVHCIVVLLLTLGREHTGEKYICCYVEEYDQLVFIFDFHISNANTFGCVWRVWTNIDGHIWILPTCSPKWYYLNLFMKMCCVWDCEMEMVVMAQ